MKRGWYLLTVLALVALATGFVALAGCSKQVKETAEAVRVAQDAKDGNFTVKGEKGEEVKVETGKTGQDSGSMTVTNEKGETTKTEYGKDTVKESDVGIAFYPGATVETGVKATQAGDKQGTGATVSLLTSDSVDQVGKFYKDKYGKGNTVIEQPDSVMITIKAGENAGKMIMIAAKEGQTQIVIHSMKDM